MTAATSFEPTAIATVAQDAQLSVTALEFWKNISNPLMLHLPSVEVTHYDDQMAEMVRYAGHCANIFLDLCAFLDDRAALLVAPVNKALMH